MKVEKGIIMLVRSSLILPVTLLSCQLFGDRIVLDLKEANEVFGSEVSNARADAGFQFLGQTFLVGNDGVTVGGDWALDDSGFGAPLPAGEESGFGGIDDNTKDIPGSGSMDFPERITSVEDLFRVEIRFPDGRRMRVDTHVFGPEIKLIPYADTAFSEDASGNIFAGDAYVAEQFPPGSIGYTIKHQRPQNRIFEVGDIGGGREEIKLQDRHIGIIVGIEETDGLRVITINNPQDYQNGRFGDKDISGDYPMIFTRPTFPEFIPEAQRGRFIDNIRTMMVGFNTVSRFPRNYDGGDPLSAINLEEIQEMVRMMILAVGGDGEAAAFFERPENYMYCAELAYIGTSAGMQVPLHWKSVKEIGVSREQWSSFQTQIRAHNEGHADSFFLSRNANPHIHLVKLAPESELEGLEPTWRYAENSKIDAPELAFEPLTMAHILDGFMRVYFQREKRGEEFAAEQAAIMANMEKGLFDILAIEAETENGRMVSSFYAEVLDVVGTEYDSYVEFRKAVGPYLERASRMTGGNGVKYFTPPSLFHLVLNGMLSGRTLLGLEYVGHGIHFSLVRVESP